MDVDKYQLSLAINCMRCFLLKESYFEVHLYSLLDYKIENTSTFEPKKGHYLRYNPEPDIWMVGNKHDKFFWIGSMFRNESKISPIHSYEFTVIDIYSIGNKVTVKKAFLQLLKVLETKLSLSPLSKVIIEIKHGVSLSAVEEDECWILLNDYPKDESFYDGETKSGRTNKFELFYKRGNQIIEIAACGELGKNANPKQFLKNEKQVVSDRVLRKGFVGFGIGLERLLLLYSKKKLIL